MAKISPDAMLPSPAMHSSCCSGSAAATPWRGGFMDSGKYLVVDKIKMSSTGSVFLRVIMRNI